MSLPVPGWTAQDIVAHLHSIGTEEVRAGMGRFGINTATALCRQCGFAAFGAQAETQP